MNKVSFGAWGATIIWVGIIGWVAYTKRAEFAGMAPNAIGDFLAGTVSPLALIWLVAGYLQQGKELALNTRALLLQQDELAKQVAETGKLALHAQTQAEIAKDEYEVRKWQTMVAAVPVLNFNVSYQTNNQPLLMIKNDGGSIFDIHIITSKNNRFSANPTFLQKGESANVNLDEINIESDSFTMYCRLAGMPDAPKVEQFCEIKNGRFVFEAKTVDKPT